MLICDNKSRPVEICRSVTSQISLHDPFTLARQRHISVPFIKSLSRFLGALAHCLYELINSWLSIALEFSSAIFTDPLFEKPPKYICCQQSCFTLHFFTVRILAVVKRFNLFPINSFLSPSIQPSMHLYCEYFSLSTPYRSSPAFHRAMSCKETCSAGETKSVLTVLSTLSIKFHGPFVIFEDSFLSKGLIKRASESYCSEAQLTRTRARVKLRGKLEFRAVLGGRKGVYSLKMSDNRTR